MGHHIWPVGQAVKTPPFHGGIGGSIPPPVTKYGRLAQLGERLPYKQNVSGSIPLAPTIFSPILPQYCNGPVVQLVRMPPCHGGGRGFESHPGRHYASVAQLVEQRTENPCVHSSILC
jgi:hypothetical protein